MPDASRIDREGRKRGINGELEKEGREEVSPCLPERLRADRVDENE